MRATDTMRTLGSTGQFMTAAFFCLLNLTVCSVPAAAPVVDYVYPPGGQRGATFGVTIGSKKDGNITPWPAKVWTDSPGIELTPGEANGHFTAHIAADAPLGPHLLRFFNSDGSSVPRTFVVDRHAEVMEQEPNDDPHKPQAIDSLPAIVNGRLEKNGDVDSFTLRAEAGQWIVAELTCHRLGSLIDPALHLLDPDGVEVAFNHDTFGLDPLIAWRAARSGKYVVQVVGFDYPPSTEVRFAGSKEAVYRLLLTTGPYARYAFPYGARRGEKGTLHLFGWNLGSTGEECPAEFDASALPTGSANLLLGPPVIDNLLPVALCESAAASTTDGAPLKPPIAVDGRIAHAGDVNRCNFTATKGQTIALTIPSSILDLPLDAMLSIEDSSGKQLAAPDDEGTIDHPPLRWTAPADGTYRLAVSDRNHAGGAQYIYRVEMKPIEPDFAATFEPHDIRLEAGKSAELKVMLKREAGHAAPLAVVLSGLPEGVTAASGGATTDGGPITITLAASPTTPAAGRPVRVLVVSADESHPATRVAASNLGPESPMLRTTSHLWLTILPRTSP